MSLMPNHSDILAHALLGYEQRKAEITETITRIRATLDGKAPTNSVARAEPVHVPATTRKPHMSPSARRRMSMLMKRRWEKAKRGGKKRLG